MRRRPEAGSPEPVVLISYPVVVHLGAAVSIEGRHDPVWAWDGRAWLVFLALRESEAGPLRPRRK